MATVIEPKFRSDRFTCPQCGTLAEQRWWTLTLNPINSAGQSAYSLNDFTWCYCKACDQPSLWTPSYYPTGEGQAEGQVVWPIEGGPPPHEDMPSEALRHYSEARSVLGASPQAAAALLRVATEAIVHYLLGRADLMLDRGIEELVKRDVIRTSVKQACDVLRITGNQMLHPGQIDPSDANADVARRLFVLVNLIVEQAITEPALVAELHAALPPSKLDAIETRDRRAIDARSD